MSHGWAVPEQPEQREADRRRRRRYLWAAVGAMVGLAANIAVLVVSLVGPVLAEDTDELAYAGLAVVLLSGLFSLLLLVAGGLLAIAPRLRPFAIGLLIGTSAGLISTNGVCVAILAAYG